MQTPEQQLPLQIKDDIPMADNANDPQVQGNGVSQPEPVIKVWVCSDSGQLVRIGCRDTEERDYLVSRVPTRYCAACPRWWENPFAMVALGLITVVIGYLIGIMILRGG